MDAASGIPTLKNRTAFWLVTAILTGGIIMGLELVAFRLYAPYFGYSIYVWGSMISVVMVALSAGYVLGGWVADRSRTDRSGRPRGLSRSTPAWAGQFCETCSG